MKHQFYKYHGAGNDFILMDARNGTFRPESKQIAFLCDRHFGIGADGLILLTHAAGYDFGMRYYNSDGKESTMCGNGGRCITAFAHHLNILVSKQALFSAIDGPHEAVILDEKENDMMVRLKMKDVDRIENHDDYVFLNTGSPHYVRVVSNLDDLDIRSEGYQIRHSESFSPGGTNVNFIEYQGNTIKIRTYERGVEDETLACGTGVTAASLVAAAARPELFLSPVTVNAVGGQLKVYFIRDGAGFHNIWLEGPARKVFEGIIEIE